jgi:hypothetical protein
MIGPTDLEPVIDRSARDTAVAADMEEATHGPTLVPDHRRRHYKGKQWWRTCDNKSFQDIWIVKGRPANKVRGDWGYFEVTSRIPANEELDRTCAEKGLA